MSEAPRAPRRAVWIAYEYVAMVAGLGFLALLCLLWLPFAMILQAVLPRRWGQPIGRGLIMLAFRIYLRFLALFCACRFDLAELDALRADGPMVLVANHPSLLDVVMIASRFPNMVCIMKAALMDNILLGAAARLACYIPNNAPLEMVRRARQELREGAQLLIFPEGTRTVAFPLNPCTPGAGLIAGRADVPVQTLLIDFSSPYLGKAWPLFRRPELPLHVSIRVGRRFPPPANVAAFSHELEAYFRAELTA
ncbi:MAG TPA: lysophospholipid acyltransferase family protein [Rhodocyclaceae bacterium]|nr:lysophospholipid acyltransferase family protein [Rhodocyclaceae bacterium]